MRLAPIPMAFRADPSTAIHLAGESSKLTHNHPDAVDACRYLAALVVGALEGARKKDLLQPYFDPGGDTWSSRPLTDKMAEVARGNYREKNKADIHPSADAALCLEAALWAFSRTDSYEQGCLLVVNMGDDSDTTAAVYGQIAGAYYGYDAIPPAWREEIAEPALLRSTALSLLDLSTSAFS